MKLSHQEEEVQHEEEVRHQEEEDGKKRMRKRRMEMGKK